MQERHIITLKIDFFSFIFRVLAVFYKLLQDKMYEKTSHSEVPSSEGDSLV